MSTESISRKSKKSLYIALGIGGSIIVLVGLSFIVVKAISFYSSRGDDIRNEIEYNEEVNLNDEDDIEDKSITEEEKEEQSSANNNDYKWHDGEFFSFKYPKEWEVKIGEYLQDNESTVEPNSIVLKESNSLEDKLAVVGGGMGHGLCGFQLKEEGKKIYYGCDVGQEVAVLKEPIKSQDLEIKNGSYSTNLFYIIMAEDDIDYFATKNGAELSPDKTAFEWNDFILLLGDSETFFISPLPLGVEQLTGKRIVNPVFTVYPDEEEKVSVYYETHFKSEEEVKEYLRFIEIFFSTVERKDLD